MNILKVNGIELAYDSFGNENDEAIILVAGLGTQMIRWTVPFCELLAARGFRVIRFDNRDVGCSTHFNHYQTLDFDALATALMSGQRPDIPYTLDDMSNDVIGLLDALSIDRAHVVGRSMGGMIAQIAASEHPERVLSITSIMSSSGNPSLPQASPDVMGMMTRPAPSPFEDEAGFWHTASLLPDASPVLAIRLKKARIENLFWRRPSGATIQAVSDDKLLRSLSLVTVVRDWQP